MGVQERMGRGCSERGMGMREIEERRETRGESGGEGRGRM